MPRGSSYWGWPRRLGAGCGVSSQPATFLRDAQRLRPVPGAGLLDAGGQVVPHCALGKIDGGGDLGDRGAVVARRQDVPFARRERAGAAGQRGGGKLWVDDLLALPDLPDRLRELIRRRIFQDKSRYAGFHRTPEVARAAERGEDDDLDVRVVPAERRGGGEAVHARHLDVKQRYVRGGGLRGFCHFVAAADLRDDLDVVLKRQQRRQCLADHRLVLGEQYPNQGHVVTLTPSRAGTVAMRQKPRLDGRSSSLPPTEASRSDMPCSPAPATAPAPASAPIPVPVPAPVPAPAPGGCP